MAFTFLKPEDSKKQTRKQKAEWAQIRAELKALENAGKRSKAEEKKRADAHAKALMATEKNATKCVTNICKSLLKVLMQHKDVLAAKRKQTQYKNDYGILIDNGWEKEKEYFIKNVLLENKTFLDSVGGMFDMDLYDYWHENISKLRIEFTYTNSVWKIFITHDAFNEYKKIKKSSFSCVHLIDNLMDSYEFMGIYYEIIGDSEKFYHDLYEEAKIKCYLKCDISSLIDAFLDIIYKDKPLSTNKKENSKTPLDYEHEIANKLKAFGFNARVTKASGDQGADVIADKDGTSFAIQCKKHSKPIGNKAVQEANAGRDFYKKDFGVVVTNADFTKSARQLANACDIILLNDCKLQYLLTFIQ